MPVLSGICSYMRKTYYRDRWANDEDAYDAKSWDGEISY